MIDLKKQLTDLFNKEHMLGFFDFRFSPGGSEPLSGLCKISRPKGSDERGQYVSLLFLIDTPNESLWRQVDAFTNAVDWNGFRARMPGVQTVLPIPTQHCGAEICFKELDIYLDNSVVVSKAFVMTKLYPAITHVMGLKAGELVYWDDLPESKRGFESLASDQEAPRSILEKVRDFLGL
jgi:hypothetical protein